MNDQNLNYPDLDDMLKQMLERLGWSQRDLACELDEDDPTVSRVLRKKAGVKVGLRIARKVMNLTTRLLPEETQFFEQYATWAQDHVDKWTSDSWEEHWRSLQEKPESTRSPRGAPTHTLPLDRPPRVQHFTGRKQEIEQISKDLQPGRVITLWGPGGIGKSAIVAEAVWSFAPGDEPPAHFPDGIIFHDFYKEPQAAIALEKIARRFGEEPRPTPAAAAQRTLSGRKILLVLEGVENTDDLDAVLAVRGNCGVLITSRSRKDVIDLDLDVVPLLREEAIKVLQAWGGARITSYEITEEICRLVGELPLAVRLAGRYMAEHEEDGADYLAWLRATPLAALDHGKRQHESIPLLLQRSLDQVSEAAQGAMAVVGLLALASFSPEVIATALDRSINESRHLLGELVRYSLLERPESYYRVTHALVHTYAKWRLRTPGQAARQLATYYIKLAQEQSELGQEGYTRLDAERTHIIAILTKCVEQQNWEEVQSLAKAIDTYLDRQGHWSERVIANEAGLKAAQTTKDRQAEAAWLSNLGAIQRRMGNVHDAISFYERAVVIFQEVGNQQGEAESLRRLAGAYRFLTDINTAMGFHAQSLEIARTIADQSEEANNLSDLGIIYVDMGKKHQAIALYEQALTIFHELGNPVEEAKVLGNLGVAYANLGEIRHAIMLYEQSQEIARKVGDRKGEADNLNDLGNAYFKLGDVQQAIMLYGQYLDVVRELGDREGEGLALLNLGEAYFQRGEIPRAIKCHEQSLAIVREIGDSSREAGNLNGLGKAYAALGDTERSINCGEQALAIARHIPDRDDEARALATLAAAYIVLGEKDKAILSFKQAIQIAREVGNQYTETQWTWELALFYEKLGDYKQAASLMAITVEYERAIGHIQARSHARRLTTARRKVA